MRKRRWWGDPAAEFQPDAGDLLVYQSARGEWYHLVQYATRVRGGGPHDLWLVVERRTLSPEGGIPDDVYERIMDPACRSFTAHVR